MSKAEKTRNFIIEKTAPIFNMKGYAGTSLNDITSATGLTKGSIYGNFANKDEVALAAFDYNLAKVAINILSEINKKTSVSEKLLVYVNMYSCFLTDVVTAGGCPILNTAIDSDDTHPALRQKVLIALLNWKKNIVRLIELGIQNKEIREDVNPEQTALTFIAMLEGAVMISRLTSSASNWNLIMDSIKEYIERLS